VKHDDAHEPGIHTRVWRNGTLEAENFPFAEISDYLEQEDCLVWADICAPDSDRLNDLADELSLDPHAIEDATAHRERPKANRYDSHLFLAVYAVAFDPHSGVLRPTQVSAFVTKRAIVTVRQRPDFDIDQVTARWDENSDLIKFGTRALVWGLLDVIVDGHFNAIQDLDDEIETIEDLLFDDSANVRDIQRRSFTLRKSLVIGRRVILPMREVLTTLNRREIDPAEAPMIPYYEDLYDHVLRVTEWTESLRDMISTIFETNLSLADARMNTIMKKLTSWAAIIAVPTAITGYFGQNVPYPGYNQHWGFWLSAGVIVFVAAALYTVFRLRDWL
jgi:magnesium transporter